MTALATVADLGVRLGLDLSEDARAATLLDDVSAALIAEVGVDFALHHDDEATVDVCCGKAKLPHGPVVSVDAVEADGDAVTFTWTSGRTISDLLVCGPVVVTYTWGFDEVPADIIGLVCQIAGRAYGTNPQVAGAPSESLGGWQIGATPVAAASGPFGLLPAERAVLARYTLSSRSAIRMGVWA